MRKKIYSIAFFLVTLLFTASAAIAQNSYVNGYSTISYDSATNTVSGYSYSQPSYTNAAYYRTGVSANIYDQNGNSLTSGTAQGSNGSSAQVNLQVTGNGCGYYQIGAGHFQVETYYVYNYYNGGTYQSGYYDPYNYSSFSSQSSNNYYGSYQFVGNGPVKITFTTVTVMGGTQASTQGNCNLGPVITGISPNYGAPGSTKPVAITGFGFDSATTVESDIPNSPITFSNTTEQSPQRLITNPTIDSNAFAGSVPIRVKRNNQYSDDKSFEIRVPHHLKVISDQFFTKNNCAFGAPVARVLTLEVVDVNDLPVGATQVRENFTSVSDNSCGNDSPLPSSCAYTDYDFDHGRFADIITVACNTVNGTCGYDITDQWQWCPPGRTPVTLATLNDSVHYNQVTVNGYTSSMPANYMLMP